LNRFQRCVPAQHCGLQAGGCGAKNVSGICFDFGPAVPIVAPLAMNTKLLFKTVFAMLVLLLLVMIGYNNRNTVPFTLPPIVPKAFKQPAAYMYFGFFAVGFITATVIFAGGGKKGSSSGGSKPPKKDR
jgi:uncharacterized integral membrane protein